MPAERQNVHKVKKQLLVTKLERAAKWIHGSKFVPYSDSFKEALLDESVRTLEGDLDRAKEKMREADPFSTEGEIEHYLDTGN